jgi:hypothetical protein
LELRKRNTLVAFIWYHSPVSGLGKSTILRAFSVYLFKVPEKSGDAIDSQFRFAETIDSVNCFRLVDEANSVNWIEKEDILKNSPESYDCTERGQADLTKRFYKSRSTLGITTNQFRIKSKNTMVRIIKVEFDSTKVSERKLDNEQVKQVKNILSKLKPIGWRLAELELESIDYLPENLISRIENHESKFMEHCEGIDDPRRYTAWAVIYEGLKICELPCIKFNLEWRAPTYKDFVKDVINKIEGFGKETTISALSDFVAWWNIWKANKYNLVYTGQLWMPGKRIKHKDSEYKGDIVTDEIMRLYRNDKNAMVDNLRDLATEIQSITGIPDSKLRKGWGFGTIKGNDGKKKSVTKHGLFIPYDIRKFRGFESNQQEEESIQEEDESVPLDVDEEF